MRAISLVPEFGRVAVGELGAFDNAAFRKSTRNALPGSGIRRFILGLDASLNHDDGKPHEAHWQLRWRGFFEEPDGPWREQLKSRVNPSGIVSWPIKVITPDSLEAAAVNGLKNSFKRRVSYVKTNRRRSDRGSVGTRETASSGMRPGSSCCTSSTASVWRTGYSATV